MVSFAFLLCSTLLLSGAIAAPYPGDTDEVATAVATVTDSATVENKTLTAEIAQHASQAGIKVLTDVLDGKDLQTSLLDRAIEAFGKIRGEVASIGHSFLERLRELKDGLPLEKIAGNFWKSMQKKFAGKSKNFDEIVEATGVDNLTAFVESATKVVKESITTVIQKRREAKALEGMAIEARALEAPIKTAEEVHEKIE